MRIGCCASSTSTGVLDMFCEGLVTASMPSLSGRPPQAPVIMSTITNGRRSAVCPPIESTVLPPSPAAGTRSGRAWASAPSITSSIR